MGSGSYGTVYKGFNKGLGKEVAIKVLDREWNGTSLIIFRTQ